MRSMSVCVLDREVLKNRTSLSPMADNLKPMADNLGRICPAQQRHPGARHDHFHSLGHVPKPSTFLACPPHFLARAKAALGLGQVQQALVVCNLSVEASCRGQRAESGRLADLPRKSLLVTVAMLAQHSMQDGWER